MLDSVPVPFQVILWPLVGSAFILVLSRILPDWARRLLAMVAALVSLAALWSLKSEPVARVGLEWLPINLFRMGPTLYVDGLSLLVGMLLAGVSAAMILGVRWRGSQGTGWHGFLLALLAGCLAATMAANLLALALASALIDLALISAIVSISNGPESSRKLPLSAVVPGVLSTLVLFVAALQMDSRVGHASFLAQSLPETALVLVGVAGALRTLIFPLHPRNLRGPESAATLLLPVGVGGYLLVRVQTLAPALSELSWAMVLAAVALLAGGLLVWSSGAVSRGKKPALSGLWSGILVQQTGFVLAFVLLLAGAAPWSLVGLTLALSILVLWWSGTLTTETPSQAGVANWMTDQIRSWQARAQSYTTTRIPRLGQWQNSWLGRYGAALLPAVALASLMGAPFTVGARGRWPVYALGLKRGDASLLIFLAADTFLAAGLWIGATTIFRQARRQRIPGAALVAMLALIIPLIVWGIAPGVLSDDLGLKKVEASGVSAWGLGLVYVLPWLLGAWLGRVRRSLEHFTVRVHDAVNLDWLYRTAGWVGDRLAGVVRWLGIVGEGDGWWGWVLILLALGVFLLAVQ
jgi:hypothetical protein